MTTLDVGQILEELRAVRSEVALVRSDVAAQLNQMRTELAEATRESLSRVTHVERHGCQKATEHTYALERITNIEASVQSLDRDRQRVAGAIWAAWIIGGVVGALAGIIAGVLT